MKIDKTHWLYTKKIAHRGLWNDDIPENSLPAYQNAVDNHYAIEIDLYKTTDGEIVVFHDKTLDRMTGVEGNIYEKTLAELKSLRLFGTENTIPTLSEVLEVVDGKTPLLIEIKDQPDKTVVEDTIKLLRNYKGDFALQSFNPLYINKVKKLAPEMIRGILGTASENTLKGIKHKIVKDLLLNFLIKPQFISYDFKDLPLKKRKVKKLPLLAWTITNDIDYANTKKYCDNVIFENFIPKD